MRSILRFTLVVVALAFSCFQQGQFAQAEHQTATVSPIVVGGSLPYTLELVEYDFGAVDFPTLQSHAAAKHNGLWVFIAGRTNGLHGFNLGGLGNFPAATQNREVWVVDPVAKQTWHRSLEDAASGFTTSQVDAITPTNNQFYEHDGKLYMTGGYGFDRTNGGFKTFGVLVCIDLEGIITWTKGGAGAASDHIRFLQDPLFKVTGGAMYRIGTKTHLVFGQDFVGGYNSIRSGVYTKRISTFEIVDDGTTLSYTNLVQSPQVDAYRRRDLNVVPRIHKNQSTDELEQGLIALSGVFTPTLGGWTVPVEFAADGTPTMADPNLTSTFKQGMNNYHSAKFGFYSENCTEMHTVSFGGISLQEYDRVNEVFVTDNLFPFINQLTDVVIDANGAYTQHLLSTEFPAIVEGGNTLRFGANAEFLLADGIQTYENGVIKFDTLTGPTTVGYVAGGIAATAPNNGPSTASGRVFQVIVTPLSPFLADFNNDGSVDGSDFLVWQNGFGTPTGATKADGDANGDGAVNGQDFLIWQNEFGSSVGGAAAAAVVPTPVRVLSTITSSYGRYLGKKAKEAPTKKKRRRFRTQPLPARSR